MSKQKFTRNRGLNKQKSFPTVEGWGINDADYKVTTRVDGRTVMCPIYNKWVAIIKRSRNQKLLAKRPSLVGNSVHPDWKYFSRFKLWMESKIWVGLEIDKDILVKGNKEYGPYTCCFVPNYINMLVSCNNKSLIGLPLGVTIASGCTDRYVARLQGAGGMYLGSFGNPMEAHRVWCLAKATQIENIVDKWRAAGEAENFSLGVARKLLDRAEDLRLNVHMESEVKFV